MTWAQKHKSWFFGWQEFFLRKKTVGTKNKLKKTKSIEKNQPGAEQQINKPTRKLNKNNHSPKLNWKL